MKYSEFEDCKGPLHHSWYIANIDRKTTFGVPVWYRCERCGTEKKEVYDIHGNLAQRKYYYPEGYKDTFKFDISSRRLRMVQQHRIRFNRKRSK